MQKGCTNPEIILDAFTLPNLNFLKMDTTCLSNVHSSIRSLISYSDGKLKDLVIIYGQSDSYGLVTILEDVIVHQIPNCSITYYFEFGTFAQMADMKTAKGYLTNSLDWLQSKISFSYKLSPPRDRRNLKYIVTWGKYSPNT